MRMTSLSFLPIVLCRFPCSRGISAEREERAHQEPALGLGSGDSERPASTIVVELDSGKRGPVWCRRLPSMCPDRGNAIEAVRMVPPGGARLRGFCDQSVTTASLTGSAWSGTAGSAHIWHHALVRATEAMAELEGGNAALQSARWHDARQAFEASLAQTSAPEAMDGLGMALWRDGRCHLHSHRGLFRLSEVGVAGGGCPGRLLAVI